ncbi:uncharacterized protein EMH_0035080 [Eimeria mitis]|uniref:Uncharacterized protein n=1 Tax=Eimeria mitis TaxID=44415 RepID=U6JWC2_9EIME|nr:uncharacterized protein EMH_0035080 [Eimeria mitis]CDJ27818.1 hypothetical protein EMH_0035080 [Eimeria mitis]
MRESLNQKEVTLLVGYVQELAIASAARERATKRMDYAFHGMINIGRQFLVLDAIVSALHVLGVPPLSCSWWEAFATCFDTDYRYAEPGPRAQESGKVNVDLANRMLVAMSIYKTGNRPNPEEILDMKRTLFFSPHMAFFFKRRREAKAAISWWPMFVTIV